MQYSRSRAGRTVGPRADYTDRRSFLGTAGMAAAGAAVAGGCPPTVGAHPTQSEVQEWSLHFNLPWHEFQPRWAERVYQTGIIDLQLASPQLLIISPSNKARTLVLREFTVSLRPQQENSFGDDDPAFNIATHGLDVFLGSGTGGRRPFRLDQTNFLPVLPLEDFIELAYFIKSSNVDTVASRAMALLVRVPLLVIGDTGQPITLAYSFSVALPDQPQARFVITAWEISIPGQFEKARF